jgi:hypothetical protein
MASVGSVLGMVVGVVEAITTGPSSGRRAGAFPITTPRAVPRAVGISIVEPGTRPSADVGVTREPVREPGRGQRVDGGRVLRLGEAGDEVGDELDEGISALHRVHVYAVSVARPG